MLDVLIVTSNTDSFSLRLNNDSILLATILDNSGITVQIKSFGDVYNGNYSDFIVEFPKTVVETECKLVIFQSYSLTFPESLRIAQEIKKIAPEIPNLFFGEEATNQGKDLIEKMPMIDYLYVGEPESVISKIVTAIISNDKSELNKINYLFFKGKDLSLFNPNSDENITDINSLPPISEKFYGNLSENQKKSSVHIEIGRGCPYQCNYCNICTSRGRKYRLISPEKFVSLIKHFKDLGYNTFNLPHDSLFVNKAKVIALFDAIEKNVIKTNFIAGGRIDNMDNELADKLISCGVNNMFFGIETGSQRMQKLINKRLDLDKALEKIEYILSKNIRVNCFFMCGFPEETEEDLIKTMLMMINLMYRGARVSILLCYFSTNSVFYKDYFDELKYEPGFYEIEKFQIMERNEDKFIIDNKATFANLYNLNTPIRKKFNYLSLFFEVFSNYPNTLFAMLNEYGNENVLKIYEDFISQNNFFKDLSSREIYKLSENPKILISDFVHSISNNKVIKSIFEFECDLEDIKNGENKIKTYNFDYEALKNKLDFNVVKASISNILIFRNGKNISISVI